MKKNDKYIFNSMKIDEDCYLLLCCFLSSNKISKICSSSNSMHFKALTIQEKQKIKEFLISIAIKIRMIDDIMRQYDTNIYDHIDNNVGFLKIKSDKKKYNLSVREACNKIIHAKSLTFNYNATKDKIEYLKPIVNFIGKKNKNHWKATIDIYKFVEQAVYFSNEYDENWSISGYD